MSTAVKRLPAWMQALKFSILVLATGCTLAGCIPVLVGAVAYGSYAATDRRSLGAQTDDKLITVRAENDLDAAFGRSAHINVTSFNRKVLLTGEVLDDAGKQRAEQIVRAIPEVSSVVNELGIGPPDSLSQQSTDAYLTTAVKGLMVNQTDFFANAYKVETESSVVYLMGRVTQREGDYAANIARSVQGVRGVVKVFDYISEEELQRMQAQQAVLPPPDAVPPPPPPPGAAPASPPGYGPGAPAAAAQ
jgi:osmotically-inducible protein OsmY